MTKPTVTIAIPAYNEGAHLTRLLRSLLKQDTSTFSLSEIIVASDGSTDNTVECARKVKNSKITILDSKQRRGKAYRQNQIFKRANSDIVTIFDADIIIVDTKCIEQMIKPLIEGKADMTSGAILELPPRTYFEEILDVSMRLKRVLFLALKRGHNVYNCHGPARAITKKFYKQISFPQSAGEDMYSYLSLVNMGGRFRFTPKSKVQYRLPAVPTDHYKQSLRYLRSIDKMKTYFSPQFVVEELNIPKVVYFVAGFHALPLIARYPIHTFLYLITLTGTHIGKSLRIAPKELWGVASSKSISHAK